VATANIIYSPDVYKAEDQKINRPVGWGGLFHGTVLSRSALQHLRPSFTEEIVPALRDTSNRYHDHPTTRSREFWTC
jgi:hypothetical protein